MRNRLIKTFVKMLFGGRSRLRLRLMMLFGIAVALLYLAPSIVARTTMVEKSINKSLNGATIEIGRKRLSWFSAVQLNDVLLRDDQGQVLIHVESLQTSRTVFGLLFDRSNLGHVHLTKPNAVVSDLSSQTNWEAFIAQLLKQPASSKL